MLSNKLTALLVCVALAFVVAAVYHLSNSGTGEPVPIETVETTVRITELPAQVVVVDDITDEVFSYVEDTEDGAVVPEHAASDSTSPDSGG